MSGGFWFTTVIGDRDGTTATLVIVPSDVASRDAAIRPLRRSGWTRVVRPQWIQGAWSHAPDGVLDLVDTEVVRIGASGANIFARERIPTTPMWRSAARERRALVVLVGPDAFPDRNLTPEQYDERLADLAGAGDVTAGLVTVRFDEYTGPYPKGWEQR